MLPIVKIFVSLIHLFPWETFFWFSLPSFPCQVSFNKNFILTKTFCRILYNCLDFCQFFYVHKGLNSPCQWLVKKFSKLFRKYSQTWANDYLRIATTCLHGPPLWSPNLGLFYINLPKAATTSQQGPQIRGPYGGSLVWQYKLYSFLQFDVWKILNLVEQMNQKWKKRLYLKVTTLFLEGLHLLSTNKINA